MSYKSSIYVGTLPNLQSFILPCVLTALMTSNHHYHPFPYLFTSPMCLLEGDPPLESHKIISSELRLFKDSHRFSSKFITSQVFGKYATCLHVVSKTWSWGLGTKHGSLCILNIPFTTCPQPWTPNINFHKERSLGWQALWVGKGLSEVSFVYGSWISTETD